MPTTALNPASPRASGVIPGLPGAGPVRFRLSSRICIENTRDLFRYRHHHFLDSFILHQRIKGVHAFKAPLAKLAETPAFKFRDASTREFTVNVVALCTPGALTPGWPQVLQRPFFDVDRVEIPACAEASVVVRGALGVFELDLDPELNLDCDEIKVGDAARAITAAPESAGWARLEQLFLRDAQNLDLLAILATRICAGSQPSAELAGPLASEFEVCAHRADKAVSNLNGLQAWYCDYFGCKHTPATAAARLERTIPAHEMRRRVELWSKRARLWQAAADALDALAGVRPGSIKEAVLNACDRPGRAVAPGGTLAVFLQEIFDSAVAAVCAAGKGSGRHTNHDRQAIFESLGRSGSTKAQQLVFGSLYQVVSRIDSPGRLPEIEFAEMVREATTRDLTETLRDWLGFTSSETVSYHAMQRFL